MDTNKGGVWKRHLNLANMEMLDILGNFSGYSRSLKSSSHDTYKVVGLDKRTTIFFKGRLLAATFAKV